MSELKFELKEWKEMNDFISDSKRQLIEYLGNKNQCEQWKYLIDEENTFNFYDADSSEYVWKKEVYRKLYMGDASHWMFWDMFNFNFEELKLEKNRLVACAKKSDDWAYEKFFGAEKAIKWREWADKGIIRIAGETDLNFKKDRGNQKYAHYRKLIEDTQFSVVDREEYLCKLDWCERRFHSLENFSLMLVPGELNNIKGNSRDRMDRFIWLLHGYFAEREKYKDNGSYDKYGHKLFSKAKGKNYKEEYRKTCLEVIYEYLSLFSDVYDYCKKIYKIDEREMVDQFLKLGEKKNFTGEDVAEYINLAEKYWQKKHDLLFAVN